MTARIGFIGLGLMGKPMARHLLAAGYTLTIFNRSRPAIDELVHEGAEEANSPRDVAMQCEIVLTMLPADADVESVIVGTEGLLQGTHPGLLVIDMSTISPLTVTSL
ncbi:MAG TPA: NAD(P)-binding domain-containing protein, partial [Ktedonobacteraceae bacterium]|nr:NAD(P)-binding domain-containing protein [Ktedonobacteraceae bacterium]